MSVFIYLTHNQFGNFLYFLEKQIASRGIIMCEYIAMKVEIIRGSSLTSWSILILENHARTMNN